ncbi:MAG: ATP-dependent nuclease [Candidatus Scalindua sp.]
MYLSNLKLWNFRKFGSTSDFNIKKPDLNLNFKKGLNVLIGENDTGKSAIIDAIKLVLRTHSYEWLRVTDEDFFQEAERFRIEIQFNDLADEEAKNFTEWLGWAGEGEEAKPFLRLIYDVTIKNGKIFPSDVCAGVDDEGYQLTTEAREYLKAIYLKPLRDAKAEFVPKKNSRLSQILQGHEAFKGNEESHYLVNLFNHFNLSIEKYFEAQKPKGDGSESFEDIEDKKGKELKDKIDEIIHELYDRTKNSIFSVSEGKLKNILEKLELSIENEINPGLGTLNRLFMAAELLHLGKPNWNGVRLGLIEELEVHLHPQAQMQIVETMQEEKNIQLILTTHSPNLASKVKLENLIICNNNNAFPMGQKYTKLDSTDYSFLERFLDTTKANLFFAKGVILVEGWAEEILLPTLANKMGFNLTEKGVSIVNVANTAFLRYAKIFQRKYEQEFNGVKIKVEKDNNGFKFFRNNSEIVENLITEKDEKEYIEWVKVNYTEMNIPIAIITDLDVKPNDENSVENGKTKKDSRTERKKKKYKGQKVEPFISPYWTLEYCLGLFKTLAPYLFEAVKNAVIEMRNDGKSISELTEDFTQKFNGKEQKEIAFEIYNDIILKNKISKSIIAQQLAHIIDEDLKKKPPKIAVNEDDEPIKYLIKAIKYACGN